MKFQISLKLYVSLFFISLTIFLVAGYSLLSAHYYVRGMDSITASDMVEVAETYLTTTPSSSRSYPARFSGYIIADDWQRMPPEVQDKLTEGPEDPGKLTKVDDSAWLSPPDMITFLMRFKSDSQQLFIAKQVTRATAPNIVGRNAAESLRILLTISVATGLVLGLVIWLSLRQVSRPVAALGNWARALGPENLKDEAPDFHYPELNELAKMIQGALASTQDSLDREHRFLRHASHELRTPISVIRNNIELMRRLHQNPEEKTNGYQSKVIDRIDRASLTMQHLTETLLWLSRESSDQPMTTPLALDSLVSNLVEDLQYLAANKNLEIEVQTSPCTAELPEVPARIVLGNLIRNAFQHTWEGKVSIIQQENHIAIVNEQLEPLQGTDDLGFGLGLQLTEQLTTKLGWQYNNEVGIKGHHVTIIFPSAEPAQTVPAE